jgi:CRP-like cAMP-binding protein
MLATEFDIDAIHAAESRVLRFDDGAFIHRRGDAGDCAYIIKSGHIEIRQKGRPVERLSAGEIFGELAMIDGKPRIGAAVAVGDAELIPIDRGLFACLIRDDEDFATTILQLMARRHRATMEMFERCVGELSDLSQADAVARDAA